MLTGEPFQSPNEKGGVLLLGESLDFPLADLTSWHIGGAAQRFFTPQDVKNLSTYLNLLPQDLPITWLGLGSNVLIRDGGIKGAVICTRGLQQLSQAENGCVVAQAGVTCAKLARFGTRLGFADAAFFAGIPGTVGGALAMNAGAFGGETWPWVESVFVMNRQGHILVRKPADYEVGYRSVKGKTPEQAQEVFIGATFSFPKRTDLDGAERIRALLRQRAQSQPIGTFNCGSVYRNPPGDYAARLIEACKLKGYRVGDAMVSPKHANFIINCGRARAQDVEILMTTIESVVKDHFGIQLHAEVRILGERE